MRIYEKRIFEMIEDDVLDKMIDNKIDFDKLPEKDKHILKYGKEHPDVEYDRNKESNIYVGIDDILEFVYVSHNVSDDKTHITFSGTIIYNDDEYEGEINLMQHMASITFFNIKGDEFDPRSEKTHEMALQSIIQELINDKIINGTIQGRDPNEE